MSGHPGQGANRHMRALRTSLAHYLIVGLAVVAVLIGAVGGWAATTDIAGAVIGAGNVVEVGEAFLKEAGVKR